MRLPGLKTTGLVGMAPVGAHDSGDLFIEKMKEAGVIDNAMFSMYFDFHNDKSKISFGSYDRDRFVVPG